MAAQGLPGIRLHEIEMEGLPDKRIQDPGQVLPAHGDRPGLPFHEILLMCLRTSPALWEAWSSMQEMLRNRRCRSWTEASDLIGRVASRLLSSGSPLLESVGRSCRKWRAQIANGLAKNQMGVRLSNGVAEGLNNQIKTLKKIANGCTNFDRFRKRVLLCLTYSKNGNR